MDEAVYYREDEGRILVKAEGHVTAALCPELKARAFARLDAEPAPASVDVDLSACDYMDSTFLGLLVGLNKRLKARSGRPIVIHRAGESCLGLLKVIGVTRLVELSDGPAPEPRGPFERMGPGPRATAEFLLDAHEELSALSAANRERFGGLTEVLREAAKKEGEGSR